MLFVNPCDTPLTRNSYSDKTEITLSDDVVLGETDIDIRYTGKGIEIVSSENGIPDEEYVHNNERVPKGNLISDVEAGQSLGLFNKGEDLDEDPLIWIATPSILIANGMDVEMGVVYLDEGLLVCLQKGAIQVQVNEEGETQTLTRGLKRGISDDQKFMSATEVNFAGMPKFAPDAVMNITIKRGIRQRKKDTYSSLDTAVKIHKDNSALLDNGAKFLEEEAERQRIEAIEAERAAKQAEEEAEARRRRDERDAEAVKRATKREKRTVGVTNAPKVNKNGRNEGASAFLKSAGISR